MTGVLTRLRSALRPANGSVVPQMARGLLPNDALDDFEPLCHTVGLGVSDLASSGDDLWMCAATTVLHADNLDAPAIEVADLAAPVGAIASDHRGGVVAAVAGHGILRVGRDGHVEPIVTTIPGSSFGCPTSLTVRDDGTILCTEGSLEHSADAWARDLFAGGRSGRVLEVAADGEVRVLADGLAFAAGVGEHADGIVVAEAWRHRLALLDPTTGRRRDLGVELPAYPTRLCPAPGGGWWLTFLSKRNGLVELVLRDQEFREAMTTMIPSEHWIRPRLGPPDDILEPMQLGGMVQLGVRTPWAPTFSYGLVARIGVDGDPIASVHGRAASDRHGITAVAAVGDRLVVASHGARCVLGGPVGDAS
ncbi:MAG: hypothetical protein QM733_01010 [Ilumatobacteraceae bacterium]